MTDFRQKYVKVICKESSLLIDVVYAYSQLIHVVNFNRTY